MGKFKKNDIIQVDGSDTYMKIMEVGLTRKTYLLKHLVGSMKIKNTLIYKHIWHVDYIDSVCSLCENSAVRLLYG